jgi:hypothetical protein
MEKEAKGNRKRTKCARLVDLMKQGAFGKIEEIWEKTSELT